MYEEMRKKFRVLMEKKGIILPGAYNALTAMQARKAGFRGIYISGAALSVSAGVPDIGILTLSEFVTFAKYIVIGSGLPCISDADTGFGEACNVARTVQEFERIGVCGIHIEDQIFPKRCGHLMGKSLVSVNAMCEKIKASTLARKDKNFLIIARTDARSVEGFDEAVMRAKAYIKAGADAIFPEALETRAEFEKFAIKVKAPLLANMTEFGVSPLLTARELFFLGYKMVIFPVSALRVSMGACTKFYGDLFESGTQSGWIKNMQTRSELYDLINYDAYTKMDKKVSGFRNK